MELDDRICQSTNYFISPPDLAPPPRIDLNAHTSKSRECFVRQLLQQRHQLCCVKSTKPVQGSVPFLRMNQTSVLEVIYFAGMSHNIMFQSNFSWIASDDVTEHIFACSLSLKNKHLCTPRPLYCGRRLQWGPTNRVRQAFVRWSHGDVFIRDKNEGAEKVCRCRRRCIWTDKSCVS